METKLYIRTGLFLSIAYYLLDTFLDSLFFYKEAAFMDIFILNVPAIELYNRLTVILLIVILLLLVRVFGSQQRISEEVKNEDIGEQSNAKVKQGKGDIFDDLNHTSIVELVGHQLKTSLSTIIGFSNLLNDKEISEQTRSMYGEFVYNSSTNLLQLFNNLIDLNGLRNDKYTVLKETCKVNKVLEELRGKYEADISHKHVQKLDLRLIVPEKSDHLMLITDRKKLSQILEKLIENALTFTHDGSIEFGYTVEENKTIRFFVTDEGAGLSMEKLESAFNHFSNGQKSLDASFDLAALRVVVAKNFAQLIDGSIWSDSKLGLGSTFYFAMPIGAYQEELPIEKVEDGGVPNWEGVKILIAEDVEPNYLLINELLRPTKAELIWARNGREAVDYYREYAGQIDLVLMDIIMPEMDGFEAASKIREMNKRIPIIGQTAYSLEYDNNPDQLINFNDYITKPIWYHELINSMIKYI